MFGLPLVVIAPPEFSLSIDAFVSVQQSQREGDEEITRRKNVLCRKERETGSQRNVAAFKVKLRITCCLRRQRRDRVLGFGFTHSHTHTQS